MSMSRLPEGIDPQDENMMDILYEMIDSENHTVLITAVIVVSSFVIVSVVVVLWRRVFPAKQQKKKVLVVKQTENFKKNQHSYLINVVTGSRREAGTRDFVQLTLTGKQGQSLTFTLNPFLQDPERKTLRRCSQYKCILLTEEDLGDLYLAEVELQSTDRSKWFLSYMVVQDMASYRQWYFPYHDWVWALDGCDARINLVPGVVSSLRLVGDNFLRGLYKHHIWRKLVTHLKNSNHYNAILSLSYCNCLSLCFIFANAMVYRSLTFSGDLRPSYTKSVLLSLLSNFIVTVVTSFLEVGVVSIEHRNRFEFIEDSGSIRDETITETVGKLQQLDSSLWTQPDVEGSYEGFGNPGDEILSEDEGFHRLEKDGALKPPSPRSPFMSGPFLRSAMRSPLASGLPRDIAMATDSTYNTLEQERKNLRKGGIKWNQEAKLHLFSKESPVSSPTKLQRFKSLDSHGGYYQKNASSFTGSPPVPRNYSESDTYDTIRNRRDHVQNKASFTGSPIVSPTRRQRFKSIDSQIKRKPFTGSPALPHQNVSDSQDTLEFVVENDTKNSNKKPDSRDMNKPASGARFTGSPPFRKKNTEDARDNQEYFVEGQGRRKPVARATFTGSPPLTNKLARDSQDMFVREDIGSMFRPVVNYQGQTGQIGQGQMENEGDEFEGSEDYEYSEEGEEGYVANQHDADDLEVFETMHGHVQKRLDDLEKRSQKVEEFPARKAPVELTEIQSKEQSKEVRIIMESEGEEEHHTRSIEERKLARKLTFDENMKSRDSGSEVSLDQEKYVEQKVVEFVEYPQHEIIIQEEKKLSPRNFEQKLECFEMERTTEDLEENRMLRMELLNNIITERMEEFLNAKAQMSELDEAEVRRVLRTKTNAPPHPTPSNSDEKLDKNIKLPLGIDVDQDEQEERVGKEVPTEVQQEVSQMVSSLLEGFVKSVQACLILGKDVEKETLAEVQKQLVNIVKNIKKESVKKAEKEIVTGEVQDYNGETEDLSEEDRENLNIIQMKSEIEDETTASTSEEPGHFSSSFLIKLETRDRTVDSSKCGSENFENVPNPSVSNDDPSEVQYHIADIQDNLDLSPVSRKLSDVVVGQVYASNMDRVERKAEDILTMSKTSRENIFHTLRNVLNVNESPPVFRTAVNVDIQPADQEKGRTEVKRAEVMMETMDNVTTSSEIPPGNLPVVKDDHMLKIVPPELLSEVKDEQVVRKIPPEVMSKVKDEHMVKVADATLQSVLSKDVSSRFEDMVAEYGRTEVHEFAADVVGSLYSLVREKLKSLLRLELQIDEMNSDGVAEENVEISKDDTRWQQYQCLLKAADIEVKSEVLPVITDHLVSLVVEEARTLETIDVDLMMLAFGGQFVETVVTNAVLQTRVGLVKGAKVLLGNDENIGLSSRIRGERIEHIRTQSCEDEAFKNLTHFERTRVTSPQEVGSLNLMQVLTKVVESMHDKLGHKSKRSLENLMEDDEKIHCGLCKPKVVKDISQRLVQMSAAKYITNQVFSSALQELKSIQDGYRVIVESGSNFDGEDHKMSLMKRVGDVLKRCHRPEVPTGCHDDRDVVGNIVGDLTEYIIEYSCSQVADQLIGLMDLDYLKDSKDSARRTEEISEVIERRVRDMLSCQHNSKVTGDGSGCHDNSNCNAAGDPMEQMNNKYAAGLSSELEEIRALVANESKKEEDAGSSLTNTEMESEGSRYHMYYYDDHKKYRIVTRSWVFFLVFGAIVILSLTCFVWSILIGLRFDDTMAKQWLMSYSLAMFQHVFLLETLKVFFLAIFASICGGRLL